MFTYSHLNTAIDQREWGYPQGFYCEVCPQGGDFDHTTYPKGGEFDMVTILDNEEGLEINLASKAFPSPDSEGNALGKRLPENNSAILENAKKTFKGTSHICERWLNER